MNVYIIGCGGVGSYLVPLIAKLLIAAPAGTEMVLVDGDTIEKKNLDRQLFAENQIGVNKANALAQLIHTNDKRVTIKVEERYFSFGFPGVKPEDFLICCADNHPCRREVLETVDDKECRAVICGNSTTDADAYFYDHLMAGTPSDPRIRFPEIATSKAGDPRITSCQGEAQVETPQLAGANFMAAALAQQLFYFHGLSRNIKSLPRELYPAYFASSLYGFQSQNVGDMETPKEAELANAAAE